jgi:hypothetical protein
MNETTAAVASDLPVPRRRLWVTLLLGLLIFGSGFIVGGGATLLALRNRAIYALHHPEKAPARIAAQLRWKLGLSDEQTQQVEKIVRKRQRALQAIRYDVQPKVEAELQLVESEIGEVLDKAQKAKWHALFTHLCNTWLPPPAPKKP